MKYQYKVKNFRVFDEDGVKIDMAPITILTGCNSSGKSSIVKSMLLVNDVLDRLSRDGKLSPGLKIDFTKGPNNLLGTFDNVIHRGSESNIITIEYTVPSILLDEDVTISMTFKRHWKLNGGVLSDINISHANGQIIFQLRPEDKECCKFSTICHEDLREQLYRYIFLANFRALAELSEEYTEEVIERVRDDEKKCRIRERVNFTKDYIHSCQNWFDKVKMAEYVELYEVEIFKYLPQQKYDISAEQIMRRNLLYCSVLESLFGTDKDNFESEARKLAEKSKDSEVIEIAVDYINSIESALTQSDFADFSEYFNNTYNKFFGGGSFAFDKNYSSSSEKSFTGRDFRLDGFWGWPEALRRVCGKDPLGDISNLLTLLTGIEESKSLNEIFNTEKDNWYDAYNDFLSNIVTELLSYRIPTRLSYIPTSIVNIKRLYSFDEKDEMTKLFRDYILSKSEDNRDTTWSFANRWLRKLNIGHHVAVNALSDGTGCEVRIYKENDDKGQLLADFGYGVSQLIFLLLRIEMEANNCFPSQLDLHLELKESHDYRLLFEKPFTIVLEEPEVHLHPKFQSMIADILLDAYKQYNFHFIVETHSEYLIRRSQVLVANMGFDSNEEAVEKSPFITYYIPEDSKPYSLGYRKDGKFMETFGTGFYDEASNLAFELL